GDVGRWGAGPFPGGSFATRSLGNNPRAASPAPPRRTASQQLASRQLPMHAASLSMPADLVPPLPGRVTHRKGVWKSVLHGNEGVNDGASSHPSPSCVALAFTREEQAA